MSLFEYDEKKHERTMMEIGREEGHMRTLVSQIIKKVRKNKTLEEMADELEEDAETIQPLYEIVIKYAPAYNEDEIMEEVLRSKH